MKLRLIALFLKATLAGILVASLSAQTRTLRVCADPDYLPYSNRAGQGFENKVAGVVAKALGERVEYTWENMRRPGGFSEFLARTLDANKCDVVIDIPFGSREELTTRPYYVSSYVFVFKKSKNYSIRTMDSPALKGIKIGFESDTPVEDGLKMRALLGRSVAFDVGSTGGESPSTMLDALEKGRIDVLITWQPAIGAFLSAHPDLDVIAVPNERALGPPEQYAFPMSMGVREKDESLQKQLDDVIAKHQAELTSVLTQYGVRLYTPQDPNQP
jgi:mxaJ protein